MVSAINECLREWHYHRVALAVRMELVISIKTANKKLLIKKHRDCGITTTAQNQADTVVFKKQPL